MRRWLCAVACFHYDGLAHGWSTRDPETTLSITDHKSVLRQIVELMGDYRDYMDDERTIGIGEGDDE